MKVTRLNESNILDECKMEELKEKLSALSDRRVTNEAVDTTDPIVESVRKYLEDLLEGLMDNRAVQTASDVPGYSTDWCSEDPVHSKAMAKLSAAAQRFIDAEMDVLFENYVSPITESIDDMDKRCEKCNTLLNDGGTCPKCDDGEEDYGDNDDEEVEECLTENTISDTLPPAIDQWLMDLAQTSDNANFDYTDISNFSKNVTAKEISRLKYLRRKFMEVADYSDDADNDPEVKTIIDKVNLIVNRDSSLTESIIVDHNISDNDIAEFDEETGNIKVDATIIPYEQNKLVTIEIDDYESSTIQQYRMIDCKDGLVELEWIAAPITEDLLTEGPIRNGLRKIKNFFNPSGAKNRSIKDHEKDEEKYRKRKAPPILARDFDTKSQGYRFYKGNTKNPKPMNYDQWMAAYGRDDLTDEEYAEWYNAKVTDEHGFYIRRGSEDLRHKHITYQPGKNDEVLKMYRVGDGIDKEDEPDPIPEPPEDPEEKKKKKKKPGEEEEDPEEKKKKKKKKGDGEEEEDEEEEDPKPPRDKGKLKDDLRRFKQLCKLTSLRVLNAEKQLMNIKEIYSQIHVDNISNYKVKLNSSIVPLPAWLDRAAREKFLPALLKASGVSESLAEMYLSEDFFKRYDFTTVGDVLEGMVNNADEKTIDSDIRLFKQIAKKLGIADMDDVVVYVDEEYLYHPSQYTDLSYLALDHISDNDIRDCVAYNCGGIDFFVQNKNGLTFLFFRSEDDGEEYLELVDEINQF